MNVCAVPARPLLHGCMHIAILLPEAASWQVFVVGRARVLPHERPSHSPLWVHVPHK